MKRITSLTCSLLLCQTALAQGVDFENDIAPILEDRCTYCHGEDEQEAGLRLDLRSSMLKGGDSGIAAIVPGKPDSSYLIEVIRHLDPDVKMPPDDDQLRQEEIELLARWIEQGANWPGQMDAAESPDSVEHWAFKEVQRPEVPRVNNELANTEDAFNDTHSVVDALLAKKLAEHDLAFSEPADPRSLLRRVSIVLTGLPPTQAQTEQFLASWEEDSDQAYADVVDRLLASEHFGERWAQHWLDVIRWAETNGSEANLYRKNAWVYRDYVVRSLNEDKPYDQFVREQIAGDSMGIGEATGFLVAGPHVPAATVGREPAAIRQARADRMDEIMQTVGASVMGLTMGCARCHNHKFDPISIRDYYAMTAVFQDVEFGSRHPEYSPKHPLRVRSAELWKSIGKQRESLREFGGWEENWGAYREIHFPVTTTNAVRLRFKGKNIGIDEIEVLGPHGLNEDFARADAGASVTGVPAKGSEGRNPIERVIDGEFGTMAWRASLKDEGEQPWVQIDFPASVEINRVRLSNNREYYYDTDYLDKKPHLPRYEFDLDILQPDGSWKPWTGTWAVNKKLAQEQPSRQKFLNENSRLIAQLIQQGPRPSFVGRFVLPATTYVLLRGSPENPRGEVTPAGPELFDGDLGLPEQAAGPKRRLAFAQWVTSEENPLTSRVMVNRIWHHIFGSGIVATTSDFGTAGALPTHPELLDWLAAEFVTPQSNVASATDTDSRPWSIKRMIRMLVMTRAFRQSSTPSEAGMLADGGSALLWRFPPRRVEAEVLRDSILLASGSLDRKVGGKSYRIHNEKKTYAQWEVVDNHGPHTWRRMLYQERMRRVDDQMFTAFDFPDCGQVRARRPVSTTPLQALNLLNSRFVVDQSERIAERALAASDGELEAAVVRCFQFVLGRACTQAEKADALGVAQSHSLAIVCRALINTNEFAFLP